MPWFLSRVIGFAAEEFGGGKFGGESYVNYFIEQMKDHILAIESDAGPFKPLGFEFTGGSKGKNIITDIASQLLVSINTTVITNNGGGADIDPMRSFGVPTMSPLVANSEYFWFHHGFNSFIKYNNSS